MNILSLFVLIPLLTMFGIMAARSAKSVRLVSASGMFLQLVLSFVLLALFYAERNAGNTATMLFQSSHMWFPSLNIHYAVGVDGISVAMILLTSIVVFAGIFASWEVENLQKEFFISLILLASGVYGFFISIDLFTMFLFTSWQLFPCTCLLVFGEQALRNIRP